MRSDATIAPQNENGTRRAFIGALAAGSALATFRSDAVARCAGAGRDALGEGAGDLAANEDYWSEIQRCFDAERAVINLNNGGVSPAPSHVLEQMIRDLRFCNELPAHHMWQVLEPRIETVRRALARQFGCDFAIALGARLRPAIFDDDVLSFGPTEFTEPLDEGRNPRTRSLSRRCAEESDDSRLRSLLGMTGPRPHHR